MMRTPMMMGAAAALLLCLSTGLWLGTRPSQAPAAAGSTGSSTVIAKRTASTESPAMFTEKRNAEIDASIQRVKAARQAEASQRRAAVTAAIKATLRHVQAERAMHAFAKARNVEIEASIARVKAEQAARFAAARNAEIEASMARVQAVRTAEALARDEEARRAAAFENARNAEIDASIARALAVRTASFEAARNAEIDASLDRVQTARAEAFHKDRNAEIEASVTRVLALRTSSTGGASAGDIATATTTTAMP